MANYDSIYTGQLVDLAVAVASNAVKDVYINDALVEKINNEIRITLAQFGINASVSDINKLIGSTGNIQEQLNGKAPNTVVTLSANGLMLSTDKLKLDTLITASNTDISEDATLPNGTLYCYYIE